MVLHPCDVKLFMRLTVNMFAQCYGFVDKFTLKFLIGGELSISIRHKGDYREKECNEEEKTEKSNLHLRENRREQM